MANTNIVGVTQIVGISAYVTPSSTSQAAGNAAFITDTSTAVTGLTPASGTVNRITSVVASNVTSSAATASIAIANNATFASGTLYYIAYQVSVPPNSSVILVDKTTSFYITSGQSVGVIPGTASAINFTVTLESITGTVPV